MVGESSLTGPEAEEGEQAFFNGLSKPEVHVFQREATPVADKIEAELTEKFGPDPTRLGLHLGLDLGAAARYNMHLINDDASHRRHGVDIAGHGSVPSFIEILTKVRDHRDHQRLAEAEFPESDLLNDFIDLDESLHPLNSLSNSLLVASLIHYRKINTPKIHMGRLDDLLANGLRDARAFFLEGEELDETSKVRLADLLEISVTASELMWLSASHPFVDSNTHLPESDFYPPLATEFCDTVHLQRRMRLMGNDRRISNDNFLKWYLWSKSEKEYWDSKLKPAKQLSAASPS